MDWVWELWVKMKSHQGTAGVFVLSIQRRATNKLGVFRFLTITAMDFLDPLRFARDQGKPLGKGSFGVVKRAYARSPELTQQL